MRKLAAILLAIPVLVLFYAGRLGRRGAAGRLAAGVAAAAVIAVVIVASMPPAKSAALPPAPAPTPVAAELLNTVTTGHPLTAPITIAFDEPMDPASVAAALRITPEVAVTFGWSPDARTLTIAPVERWLPDTLYAVSVDAAARSTDGGSLAGGLRAVVMTSAAGRATIEATSLSGGKARLDAAIRITLDRPVALTALLAALRVTPAVKGTLTAGDKAGTYVFTPSAALAPKSSYSITLAGLTDADGTAFSETPALTIDTTGAPGVVRFRPRDGQASIDRGSVISVRFTERMDRASTAAALTVTAGGKPVTGKITWAEQQKVLIFTPSAALPFGAKVVVTVGPAAVSRAGAATGRSITGAFTVVAKPKPAPAAPKPPATHGSGGTTKPIRHGGGSGAVSGSWTAVESYYLRLMNCTRTGGWVTSGGNCSSPGGRNVAPLVLSQAISNTVSRPYAKLLATRGICNHFIGGTPADRLRRAGFTSYRWGENLGCRSGNPFSAVLGSHLFFQSEKPYNGGHYVNLMNAEYDRAGIGIWVSGGRVRLVVDLYHP
ncbi:MAG: Ig-like domain-containing protein [Chloroflexota bacterium]